MTYIKSRQLPSFFIQFQRRPCASVAGGPLRRSALYEIVSNFNTRKFLYLRYFFSGVNPLFFYIKSILRYRVCQLRLCVSHFGPRTRESELEY